MEKVSLDGFSPILRADIATCSLRLGISVAAASKQAKKFWRDSSPLCCIRNKLSEFLGIYQLVLKYDKKSFSKSEKK